MSQGSERAQQVMSLNSASLREDRLRKEGIVLLTGAKAYTDWDYAVRTKFYTQDWDQLLELSLAEIMEKRGCFFDSSAQNAFSTPQHTASGPKQVAGTQAGSSGDLDLLTPVRPVKTPLKRISTQEAIRYWKANHGGAILTTDDDAKQRICDEIDEIIKQSKKAWGWLTTTVDSHHQKLIKSVDFGNVAEAFKRITIHFNRNTLSSKRHLYEKFWTLRRGNRDVATFVADIDEVAKQISTRGETVPEGHRLAVLFNGLGTSFDAIVTHLESKDVDDAVTFLDAVDRIKDFETSKTNRQGQGNGYRQNRYQRDYNAFVAGDNRSKQMCRNFQKGVPCANDPCPYSHDKPKADAQRKGGDMSKIKCWKCEQQGHKAMDCKVKMVRVNLTEEKDDQASKSEDQSDLWVFMANDRDAGPHKTKTEWVEDLTMFGCVESNPGPTSCDRCAVCLRLRDTKLIIPPQSRDKPEDGIRVCVTCRFTPFVEEMIQASRAGTHKKTFAAIVKESAPTNNIGKGDAESKKAARDAFYDFLAEGLKAEIRAEKAEARAGAAIKSPRKIRPHLVTTGLDSCGPNPFSLLASQDPETANVNEGEVKSDEQVQTYHMPLLEECPTVSKAANGKVIIKESQFGWSAYAAGDLPKDDVIGMVDGILVPEDEYNQEAATNQDITRHAIEVPSAGIVIIAPDGDPQNKSSFWWRYMDAPGPHQQANVNVYDDHDGSLFLVTNQDVPEGQALLIDYGPAYGWGPGLPQDIPDYPVGKTQAPGAEEDQESSGSSKADPRAPVRRKSKMVDSCVQALVACIQDPQQLCLARHYDCCSSCPVAEPGLSKLQQDTVFYSHDRPAQPKTIIDSGCSNHLVDVACIDKSTTVAQSRRISGLNGSMQSKIRGDAVFMATGGQVRLTRAHGIQNAPYNLVSVSQLDAFHDVSTVHVGGRALVLKPGAKPKIRKADVAFTATLDRSSMLYVVDTEATTTSSVNALLSQTNTKCSKLMAAHLRSGHMHWAAVQDITGFRGDREPCRACVQSKMDKTSVSRLPKSHSKVPLEEIHSDILGKRGVKTKEGFRTGVYFVCAATKWEHVVLMKRKTETWRAVQQLFIVIQADTPFQVRKLHTDSDTMYSDKKVREVCSKYGVKLEFSPPGRQELNGMAEGNYKGVKRAAMAQQFHSGAPRSQWGRSMLAAVYTRNEIPMAKLGMRTKNEAVTGKFGKPDADGAWTRLTEEQRPRNSRLFRHLHPFGCECHVLIDAQLRQQDSPKTREAIMVGYSLSTPGAYLVQYKDTGRVVASIDVVFFDDVFPWLSQRIAPPSFPVSDNGDDVNSDSQHSDTGSDASTRASGDGFDGDLDNDDDNADPDLMSNDGDEDISSRGGEYKEPDEDLSSTTPSFKASSPDEVLPPLPPETPEAAPMAKNTPVGRIAFDDQLPESQPVVQGTRRRHKVQWSSAIEDLPKKRNRTMSIQAVEAAANAMPDARVRAPMTKPRTKQLQDLNEDEPSESPGDQTALVAWTGEQEPKSYHQAIASSQASEWKAAMEKEMASQNKAGTWVLVPRPNDRKLIGNRWVYKIKLEEDGTYRYKARLVAQGFTQVAGIDFKETFAPVARLTTVRLLVALINRFNLDTRHIDIKTAFLNGKLEETLYMKQPQGFESKEHPDHVCKLIKAIYGTRQAGRCWNQEFHDALVRFGFTRCEVEHGLYFIVDQNDLVLLALWTDDCVIGHNCPERIDQLLEFLRQVRGYELNDLGDLRWVIGIRVTRDRLQRRFTLDQSAYIDSMLQRFKMEDANPATTPFNSSVILSKDQCPKTDEEKAEMAKVEYRSVVGSLMYAAVATRPDIAMSVSTVARFMQNPGKAHWTATKRIMRYLKGTKERGLKFKLQKEYKGVPLDVFSDSDWGNNVDNRRSQTGYIVKVFGMLVSWASTQQPTVALSSTEAEYMAVSSAAREVIWLHQLLQALQMTSSESTKVHVDSQPAIALANNPVSHTRNKHIAVRHHFIRELIRSGVVTLDNVASEDNESDFLTKTKNLSVKLFERLRDQAMGSWGP